jgi:hypothetical protein
MFDARFGTPTLAFMSQYDEVIAYSDLAWADPVAIGDRLADYQDAGGAVVVMTFSFQNGGGHTLQGRWMTGGYTPFNTTSTTGFANRTLGAFDAGSPLMQGVTTLNAFYSDGVTLTAGATPVAAYNDGRPLLAIKTAGGHTAVGINAFPDSLPSNFSGDWPRLLVNAASMIVPCPSVPVLMGHVTWQGRPAQPNTLQQLPITLTLKSDTTEINYITQTTTASGLFTVPVGGLPNDTYRWRVKDPKYLANAGIVTLTGSAITNQEMGLMRAGDADNNNLINVLDFNVAKVSFGKGAGDPGYDDRADFDGNLLVNILDFNLLKQNFGSGGSPPVGPQAP